MGIMDVNVPVGNITNAFLLYGSDNIVARMTVIFDQPTFNCSFVSRGTIVIKRRGNNELLSHCHRRWVGLYLTVCFKKDTKSDSSEVSPSEQVLKRKRKRISDANTQVFGVYTYQGQKVQIVNSFFIRTSR